MNFTNFFKKKKLDSRIVEKKLELEKILKQALIDNRYSLYEFDYLKDLLTRSEGINDYEKYELFYKMIGGWDQICKLTRDSGNFINDKMKNKDMILGIHRSNLGDMELTDGILSNVNLASIMNDGLINNGHGMQGGISNVPSVSLTVSPLEGVSGFINLVSNYKNNNVVILLEFPRELLDEDLHFINDESASKIYLEKDGIRYINPDYILGSIVKHDGIDEFYSKEQLMSVKVSKIV